MEQKNKTNKKNHKGEKGDVLLVIGAFLVVLGFFKAFGATGHFGFVYFSIDRVVAFWSLLGIVCVFMARKKNKNPNSAFFFGFIFGPLAVLYYLLCKEEMSDKERELRDWEIEKKYKEMLKEKDKN